jgi:tRNA (guanine37-N1)-methyltransferase
MIIFDIITIFPNIFESYFNTSILKRAQAKGLIKIKIHDLRHWATGKHRSVDDRPYGGGPGMVMRADVIYRALQKIASTGSKIKTKIVLLSADGQQFDQKMAYRLAKIKRFIFICGRYEGVDARVEKMVDEKISIGPYVLTGGELPVMTIVDAVSRLIPGVIRSESLKEETFSMEIPRQTRDARFSSPARSREKIGEYPQYTRPEVLKIKSKGTTIKTWRVPEVLLSGNHQKIQVWRNRAMKHKSH